MLHLVFGGVPNKMAKPFLKILYLQAFSNFRTQVDGIPSLN